VNKKIVIWPSFAVLVLIGWFMTFHKPVRREMGILSGQLRELEKKEKEIVSEEEVRAIRSEVDSLFSKLDEGMERIYPEKQLLDLGRAVENIGKHFGLKLISIVPDYESLSIFIEDKGEISELPVTMEFEGSFQEFTQFLDGISEFPLVIHVNEATLEKGNQDSTELNIKMRGVIIMRKEGTYEDTSKRKDVTNQT
jgi:Tfp pilus assembly protein PilO